MPDDSSTDEIRSEVVGQDELFTQAVLQADSDALERIISDDYIFVSGAGRKMSKEEHIASLKSGDTKYTSLTSEDIEVRAYGDTAVLTVCLTGEASINGHNVSGRYLVTRIYVKQDGHWRVVSVQATPVAH